MFSQFTCCFSPSDTSKVRPRLQSSPEFPVLPCISSGPPYLPVWRYHQSRPRLAGVSCWWSVVVLPVPRPSLTRPWNWWPLATCNRLTRRPGGNSGYTAQWRWQAQTPSAALWLAACSTSSALSHPYTTPWALLVESAPVGCPTVEIVRTTGATSSGTRCDLCWTLFYLVWFGFFVVCVVVWWRGRLWCQSLLILTTEFLDISYYVCNSNKKIKDA